MTQNSTKMKYPIGIQTFADIRNEGYAYVDKTDLVYQIAHEGRYYFLSRPRRFGKSLLISTLDAYFSAKKELFEGLAIEKLEKEWTPRPVLHIDLNGGLYSSVENMLVETANSVFIFEFKLNVGSKRAMKQIVEKDYAAPFASDSRKIYKIGVNFSTRIRGIKYWKIS